MKRLSMRSDGKISRDLIVMISALGDAYLEKGLYTEAAKRYKQLLEFKVASKHIYTNLSKAFIGLKQFDHFALEVYQKAIQHEPNNAEIYHVLADTFLSERRDDTGAMQIYEMALNHNSPNFNNLAEYLSEAYYRQNELDKCREITATMLSRGDYQPGSLKLFMQSSWQTGAFHEATVLLKKLIDTAENNATLQKHLCDTYLERKFDCEVKNQQHSFSFIDRQFVKDFLKNQTTFSKLQDIAYHLELRRFLQDKAYWGGLHVADIEKTEEPEATETQQIAVGSSAAKTSSKAGETFHLGREVLAKLSSFESLSGKSLCSKSSLTYEDFQKQGGSIFTDEEVETSSIEFPAKAEILIVIEMTNFDDFEHQYGSAHVTQVRKKLLVMLADFLEKYQMSSAWCAANGLVIVATDVIQSVALAVDFLNKLNRYNFVNEPSEHLHVSFGIHHSRDGLINNNGQTLRDLSTGIKLATVTEKDLAPEDRAVYGKTLRKTNRICLGAKAYREVKSSNRFKLNSIGQFRLKYINEVLSLHEVSWRNPTDELKFGYIRKISRFELLAELGGKGVIKVYKAKDADLHRFVILKVIQSDVFNSLPANNAEKQEFYQFAKTLGQLNHPNIVTIYEVDEDHGLTYIAREYVEGTPLTQMFSNGNAFNPDRFIKAIYQIFKGLQYGHRLGFFHLNLKPSNVLLGANDEGKLLDFLIPGALFSNLTAQSAYLAPEQVAGHGVDGRSDIFAMGVLMYEALTQRHPFLETSFSSMNDANTQKMPLSPSELSPNIPKFCDALVLKCLEQKPDKRFQSVENIVNVLKKNFERTLFSNFNVQIARSRDSYT